MRRTAIAIVLAIMAGAAHGQNDPFRPMDREQSQFLEQLAKAHPPPLPPFLVGLTGTSPKTVINYDGGGELPAYNARWRALAAEGDEVEILGLCESACTLITAHVPKDRICFGARSALNFHMARRSQTDTTPDFEATQQMLDSYPADIRGWIVGKGGVASMPRIPAEYWSLSAPQLWEMGYKRCSK